MNLKNINRADHCLNCETKLNSAHDNYCPNCGQLNNLKKETAFGLVRELVEEFLHLDSKVTRSLLPLLIKPGFLTTSYLEGKRARYFHPVRMFLTVTIIMFLVQGIFKDKSDESKKINTKELIEAINSDEEMNDSLKAIVISKLATEKRTYNIGKAKIKLENLTDSLKKYDSLEKADLNLSFNSDEIDLEKVKKLTDLGVKDPSIILDSLHLPNTFFQRFLVTQVIKGNGANKEEILEYYKHKLPWIIFSLMPVFAFVLFLVYVRKKIYFSDHLIYAFHLHTAVFVLFSIIAIVNWFSLDWLSTLLVFYIPIYYFISLKKVYKQSWLKTMLKGILVGGLYMMLGVICFMVIASLLFVVY